MAHDGMDTRAGRPTVLHYANRRRAGRLGVKQAVFALIVLAGAALGALAARVVWPTQFQSQGVLYVNLPSAGSQQALAAHGAAIRSPPFISSVLGQTRQDPAWVAKGNVSAATFAARLNVVAISKSDLIQVQYTDADPAVAASAVNLVMGTYAKAGGGVQVVERGALPSRPRQAPGVLAGGAVVGMTLAALAAALSRSRARPASP